MSNPSSLTLILIAGALALAACTSAIGAVLGTAAGATAGERVDANQRGY